MAQIKSNYYQEWPIANIAKFVSYFSSILLRLPLQGYYDEEGWYYPPPGEEGLGEVPDMPPAVGEGALLWEGRTGCVCNRRDGFAWNVHKRCEPFMCSLLQVVHIKSEVVKICQA